MVEQVGAQIDGAGIAVAPGGLLLIIATQRDSLGGSSQQRRMTG
jgi:hypothetical protein